MTYQVLARKWRPKNFTEMVGQQHVLQGLMHALEMGRLHHAYLFTGTRGVGKTTIARVIAKCLNCEKGVTATPCGECQACTEIDAGRFVDLIEIDAASRTKVEDTRDLLDNVQYAPTRGRFKIYLIDEVHMLSMHSFNALLKTLEEPPEHVKFLLATTDPHKLPVTVLSRCLQFHLRNLGPEEISTHLQHILDAEKIPAEPQALVLIARAAQGSMRDALSLLDQAIAFGQGKVDAKQTAQMLGSVDQYWVADILNAVISQDAPALLGVMAKVHEQSGQYDEILRALARGLHAVAMWQQFQAVPSTEFDQADVSEWATKLQPATVQVLYQIVVTSQRDLPLAPEAKVGFEMALLRLLAFKPLLKDQQSATTQQPQSTSASKAGLARGEAASEQKLPAAAAVTSSKPQSKPVKNARPDVGSRDLLQMKNWHDIVDVLPLNGMLKQFAHNASLISLSAKQLLLQVDKQHATMADKLKSQLQAAINHVFNSGVTLQINVGGPQTDTPAATKKRVNETKQAQAEAAIQKDANIRFLQTKFNAIIEPNSIQPVEK